MLLQVVGGGSGDGNQVAEVEGTTSPQRADLSPLPVQTPPVTPAAQQHCPALMKSLPLELDGAQSRPVRSESAFAYAWGDPPVVLICGVDRPAGFVATSGLIQINGVQWFVDTSKPDAIVWTAVDRPVYVQVSLPATADSAPVTELTAQITATLPAQPPQPGP